MNASRITVQLLECQYQILSILHNCLKILTTISQQWYYLHFIEQDMNFREPKQFAAQTWQSLGPKIQNLWFYQVGALLTTFPLTFIRQTPNPSCCILGSQYTIRMAGEYILSICQSTLSADMFSFEHTFPLKCM